MLRLRCSRFVFLRPGLLRYSHTTAPSLVLRPYQEECIKECVGWLDQGATRIGVSLPTGSGKTTVFITLLSQIAARKSEPMRAIVIVNSVELARQSASQAARMFPHWNVEIEQGAKHKATGLADFTVATYQTLLNPERLAKFDPHKVSAIIIDEAHHAAAPSYRKLLSHFHADIRHPDPEYVLPVEPGRIPIVGFSATFSRHDGLALGSVFERIVYHRDVLQMIDEEWLCEVRLTSVRVKLDLNTVKLNANGDFATASLASVMNTPTMNELVVRTWMDRAADRKSTLIFCVDVAHVHALADTFRQYGVDARFLTGKTHPTARKELVESFKKGEFPVLINCAVLTEGADIPNIDCVIVARPTRSKNVFAQIIGRGMRLSPSTGKTDCHIIDYVDTVNRMPGVMSVPTLLGLDPMKLKLENNTLDELRKQADNPPAMERGCGLDTNGVDRPANESHSITYDEHGDLTSLNESLKSRELHIRTLSRLAWVTCKKDVHVLQGKGLKLKIMKTDDHETPWVVKQYRKLWSKGIGVAVDKGFTLLTAPTIEAAVHGADSWVANKAKDVGITLLRQSPWRKTPATAAQVKEVMKLHEASKEQIEPASFLASVGLILAPGQFPTSQEIESRLKLMKRGQLSDAITRLKNNAHVSLF